NFDNGTQGDEVVVDGSVGLFNRTAVFDLPYSGSTFGLNVSVGAQATCNDPNIADTGVPVACISTVDLSSTINLVSVAVEDANGNLVPGATISAQSGTLYPGMATAAVPEPSLCLLSCFAAFGLCAITLRKKIS